jgi:Tissue inhibitor of metalloproteinase
MHKAQGRSNVSDDYFHFSQIVAIETHIMAKFLSLFITLFLPLFSLACKCREPMIATALEGADVVFRGTVVRELKETNPSSQTKRLVVKVGRVFKGCSFAMADRIVVTTSISSASCGVSTEIDKTYVFSGSSEFIDTATKKQLGKNTKIMNAVSIQACMYNRDWDDIPSADKTALRAVVNDCN